MRTSNCFLSPSAHFFHFNIIYSVAPSVSVLKNTSQPPSMYFQHFGQKWQAGLSKRVRGNNSKGEKMEARSYIFLSVAMWKHIISKVKRFGFGANGKSGTILHPTESFCTPTFPFLSTRLSICNTHQTEKFLSAFDQLKHGGLKLFSNNSYLTLSSVWHINITECIVNYTVMRYLLWFISVG